MSRHSDYWDAALWSTLGFVVLSASWRIDRLEHLGIKPWSAPGLTPGVVGALMIMAGVALACQAHRQAALGSAGTATGTATGAAAGTPADDPATGASRYWGRTLLAGAICISFAGLSPGRGMPFAVDTALFIFGFITVFSWSQWRAEGRLQRALPTALAVAVVAAGAISWLFESVFLVRLP